MTFPIDMISSSTDKSNLTLTVTTEQKTYASGALPTLVVVLQNHGKSPVDVCTYMLRHRYAWGVTARGNGMEYAFTSFVPQEHDLSATAEFKVLRPGQQLIEKISLSQFKHWGFVRTAKQPPVLSLSDITPLPPGEYKLATLFSPWAVVYQGEPGKHDRKIAMARIPDDLGLPRDMSKIFRGEVIGAADVTIL